MVLLIGSIVFASYTYSVIKEYSGDKARHEWGYRLWSVGLAAELSLLVHHLCNIN